MSKTMPEESLGKGVALVVDNNLDADSGDAILEVLKKIRSKGIPYCAFTSINQARAHLANFLEINFVILDWKLYKQVEGVQTPEGVKQANTKKNIAFLKEIQKHFFAPVFIMTAEAESDVRAEIEAASPGFLKTDEKQNYVFIKTKTSLLMGNSLFEAIEGWIKGSPPVYLLKMWGNSFLKAKNEASWKLFQSSPLWPQILWESFKKDGVDESSNLYALISQLVRGYATPNPLEAALISATITGIDDDIKRVIQSTMYLSGKKILPEDLQPGDIFKGYGNKYFINVRPVCDTVISRKSFDGNLYLLEGLKISTADLKNFYNEKHGSIKEEPSEYILFGVGEHTFYRFSFKKLSIAPYKKIKKKRVQRLLPPYATYLQQKYASYLSRIGQPRFPKEVIESLIGVTTVPAAAANTSAATTPTIIPPDA